MTGTAVKWIFTVFSMEKEKNKIKQSLLIYVEKDQYAIVFDSTKIVFRPQVFSIWIVVYRVFTCISNIAVIGLGLALKYKNVAQEVHIRINNILIW